MPVGHTRNAPAPAPVVWKTRTKGSVRRVAGKAPEGSDIYAQRPGFIPRGQTNQAAEFISRRMSGDNFALTAHCGTMTHRTYAMRLTLQINLSIIFLLILLVSLFAFNSVIRFLGECKRTDSDRQVVEASTLHFCHNLVITDIGVQVIEGTDNACRHDTSSPGIQTQRLFANHTELAARAGGALRRLCERFKMCTVRARLFIL
jgi:hypothetical protein